jgi:hypothetical protein
MDLNGVLAFVGKSLSPRAAINIVLAAVLWGGALAVGWLYMPASALPPGQSIWNLPATAFAGIAVVLVICFVVAIAIAALFIHAVEWLIAHARATTAQRTAAREAVREQDRLAGARREADARDKERLAQLLPSYPDEHRAILAQFADAHGAPVKLRRVDGLRPDAVTQALVTAGYLSYVAPVDDTHALYVLHQNAAEPVRTYVDGVRQTKAAQRRERAEVAVRDANSSARELLKLFGAPNLEDPGVAPHPWLTYDVYASINGLIDAGVLARVTDGRQPARRSPNGGSGGPSTVPIALTEDGKAAVERYLLERPIARTRIELHLDRIASSVDRGSGLRNSY